MNRYLRCYAEISLEAIGHNIREVKKRLPEGVKLLGVVKANAYGNGAVPVASYLENQVDYFATATIEEAVELRENGISAPILILGYVSPSQYGDLVEYDITQTIDSYAQALALEKEAARQNRKAKAHLAVDTGMTRIGFQVTEHDADEAAKIGNALAVIAAGVLNSVGKKFPSTTGNGVLMKGFTLQEKTFDKEPITIEALGRGFVITGCYFLIGRLLAKAVPGIHYYAWTIIACAVCKIFDIIPEDLQSDLSQWYKFMMKVGAGPAVYFAIGYVYTDLGVVIANMSVMYFILTLLTVIGAIVGSWFI